MNIKWTFIIFSISLQVIYAKFISSKFEKEIIALIKVLKYTIKRPEQMNLDTTIGITLAEANIRAVLQHKNLKFLDAFQKKVLMNTLQLSENTQKTIYALKKITNRNVVEFYLKINQPEIWIKPVIWRKINIEKRPNPNLTLKESINLMFAGHPQENESDYCLINLINNCQFFDKCQDFIMHNDNTTTGYPLTHKLLMIQVMFALQCKTNITEYHSYLTFEFCSLILQDLINLEAMSFPFFSKDLVLEQVFLCGMEGYLDFLDDHYTQLILDWQHPSGCYIRIRYNKDWNWRQIRIRRAANFTDFGCLNHATGLGIAVLALIIRKDIEMLSEP